VSLGRTAGEMSFDPDQPRATTVDLTGRPVNTNNLWELRLTLRGITNTLQVKVDTTYRIAMVEGHEALVDASYAGAQLVTANSLASIARVLAASVNAGAAEVYTAVADGVVLVIPTATAACSRPVS
jgi:hypothetical protein